MNFKDLLPKTQWEQLKTKLDAPAPEKRKKVVIPEPEEVIDYRNSDEVVTMFQCSHCGKWTSAVTRSYVIRNKDLVPSGEAYCSRCLPKRKMVSLNTIAERRPVKVTPMRIKPRKLTPIPK